MPGFEVDLDELDRAAASLRSLDAEHRDEAVTRYWINPGETGHPDLAAALADFQEVSDTVQRRLPADAAMTADRLAGNAQQYRDLDTNLSKDLRHDHGR